MTAVQQYPWEPAERILASVGIPPGPVIEAFVKYAELLAEWNERVNLTAHKTIDDTALYNFADSLEILAETSVPNGVSMVDVGSGAGFPGLPIKIARPDIRLTIVESKHKAVEFLEQVVSLLGLESIRIVNERAEVVGQDKVFRESFDVGTARASASPPVTCEYVIPLLKPGGYAYLWVGSSFSEVVIAGALDSLGAEMKTTHRYTLSAPPSERSILEIKKTSSTNSRFPRRPGIPKKRPL